MSARPLQNWMAQRSAIRLPASHTRHEPFAPAIIGKAGAVSKHDGGDTVHLAVDDIPGNDFPEGGREEASNAIEITGELLRNSVVFLPVAEPVAIRKFAVHPGVCFPLIPGCLNDRKNKRAQEEDQANRNENVFHAFKLRYLWKILIRVPSWEWFLLCIFNTKTGKKQFFISLGDPELHRT